MKKGIIIIILFFCSYSIIWANPVDNTPVTKFSELVFDNNNNWTMEIYFPFSYRVNNGISTIDSIIISASNTKSKLNVSYPNNTYIGIITSDSLTVPLSINREGDEIIIYTYSSQHGNQVKIDGIAFGNYPSSSVGAPDSGYSILRYYKKLITNNYYTLDCLTKKPSLGVTNDTVGLAGTLKGYLYDRNGKLIKNYYTVSGGNGLIFLESLLNLLPDGSFTTSIFNTIDNPNYLEVKMIDWEGFIIYLNIEPFELKNIHPDTVVYHDIHLTDTCLYCRLVDAVKKDEPPKSDELTLINYPNPFNLSTNFYIKLPDNIKNKTGNISIYNINGKLIRAIPFKNNSTTYWDARDMNGIITSSGVYYYRLIVDNQVLKNGSMILLK